jgi:hypothetical protein
MEQYENFLNMRKPKEIITITKERFWDIVKTIDWKNHCRENECKFYKTISKDLYEQYGKKTCKELSEIERFYAHCLEDQLVRYAKVYYKSFTDFCVDNGFIHGLSNDSTWYLCTFIVGCGKESYDRVMLEPTEISEFKDYIEGFSYCFIK